MTTSLLINTDDKLYSFTASTTTVNGGGYQVILSTIHPVLAEGGFDVKEEPYKILYVHDVHCRGHRTDLLQLTDQELRSVLWALDHRVHDFYFGFYPKTMALVTAEQLRLVPTRLGLPKPAGRRFSRRSGCSR